MDNYGFVKVAAASPMVKVGDCKYNAEQILKLIKEAAAKDVSVIVFPELSITAYTCGDLFNQSLLIERAKESLIWLSQEVEDLPIISIVGLPLMINNSLYNVAAVIGQGQIYGIVPKTFLPNYGEFYEKRWFTSGKELCNSDFIIDGLHISIGSNFVFETVGFKFGIELCEDLWTTMPPSSSLALHGADIIFNLSASNEIVGKHTYRKSLIEQQSARCLSAYVYASASVGESTTDLVYSGACLIAENGVLLAEGERYVFQSQMLLADIDVDKLRQERLRNKSFSDLQNRIMFEEECLHLSMFEENEADRELIAQIPFKQNRYITRTPFVPESKNALNDACEEVFSIQSTGLAKRLLHINSQTTVIGISGGLDSTLALLVLIETYDKLGIDRKHIWGITMPGFGTSDRTYGNALKLMKALGISVKEISIKNAVTQHLQDIEHDISLHDVTYENAQARERTQILMDYANKINGLVIGTGDLSELALGWCTYNGDHMSMYAVNASIPKTLVRALTRWFADNKVDGDVRKVLHDIVDTPVSPELLPADEKGEIAQKTEDVVGPYILHDFFLYYMLRYGFAPAKIYYLAKHAFGSSFAEKEILKWMKMFYRRFFTQQFKRSCLPDGPKVGSVALSPRGDWRMPSDASFTLWMEELDKL